MTYACTPRFWASALAFALLPAPAVGQAAVLSTASQERCLGRADVPMIAWGSGRPAVEVMVNGHGPFLFLIDTGAEGQGRADVKLAETLRLPEAGGARLADGSASSGRAVRTVRLEAVTLGGITFRNLETPSRDYANPAEGQQISGILGFDLFRDCLLELDYRNRRVSVRPGELRSGDPNVVPFTRPNATPSVTMTIGGRQVQADVDTGDRRMFTLPSRMMPELHLRTALQPEERGASANQTFVMQRGEVSETFAIGGTAWRTPLVSFTDTFNNINIGSAAFADKAIVFDQRAGLMQIR